MMKGFACAAVLLCYIFSPSVYADYALGCEDPNYHQYIEAQFAADEAKNRRLLASTWQDYVRSAQTSDNPYQVISDLSHHLKYSAQFDPVEDVTAKIALVFDHADALSVEQQIAGNIFDRFSSETHAVGIARAWIAYRTGKRDEAFEELLKSIEISDSAVLSSFGPDFYLVRQMYSDGHVEPVVAYINKSEEFWKGRRPDGLRYVWQEMIKADCKIQFNSVDTIQVLELGLRVLDVKKDYGLSR
ncbi:hypothetical protein KJ365_04595 [Glaciecola sp. XM2]|uniref:hypothetical protein n=1 Tax=Glaciecola sp. XM2 TaxID=1914931 RepID=UPI001BDE3499|nr:hypothetical protein [Glaciecola sp. XM2]MBT1450149.1 hypothetical protein [Glaciecola sp. XM2]